MKPQPYIMTKSAIRALDKRIERIYYANCSGVQIDIMDIGKVFAAGRLVAHDGDEAITKAVLAKVAELRKN